MINSMGYMLTQYIVCHDKQYGLQYIVCLHIIYRLIDMFVMINSMGYMLTQYIVCHDKQYGLHAYTIYSLS